MEKRSKNIQPLKALMAFKGFDLLSDPVAIFEVKSGAVTFRNSAAQSLITRGEESGNKFDCFELWTQKSISDLEWGETSDDDTAHKTARLEVTILDGLYDVSFVKHEDAQVAPHIIGVFRDITARVEAERIKKELVSTVSHELRSPLTAIKGAMGLVLSGAAGQLPEKSHKLISIAHRNADRLILIINDILDLDKITDGAMVFDNANANLLTIANEAFEAVDGFRERFDVNLKLEIKDTDLVSYVDPNRLVQVLVNLLSNAIKFSPTGGDVTVRLATHGDLNRVSVIDCGEGIPDADQRTLFERFVQVGVKNRAATGGTGLGLSIVKEILNKQGGTISFESTFGLGTTFHIDLPKSEHNVEVDQAESA